jgi:EmrB/QacA subfamily drug resistance transporter
MAADPRLLMDARSRSMVIAAALMAIFLGALDSLVVGAAMPTIVGELGGLNLYSWVFTAYLLSRAVSLPVIGKLADLFRNKTLFNASIGLFLAGSLMAGVATSMTELIFGRVLQGIGAGGNFALAYIVLADISERERRGRMMSMGSFVWGLASVTGPTIGGLVVNYFSWRWIFLANLPLGGLSLLAVGICLKETREKRGAPQVDYLGAGTLSVCVLALLTLFMLAGRRYAWISPTTVGLAALSLAGAVAFVAAERHAPEPILDLDFFRIRRFRTGNAAVFLASFAIFSLSAFSPLFIQGSLGKSPAELGLAMVPLSLGWSAGALFSGRLSDRLGGKPCAVFGAGFLVLGSGLLLTGWAESSVLACSTALGLAGVGMGFVSLATLLLVQESLSEAHLGVATSAQQFSRTLGGTLGVGISGGLLSTRFAAALEALSNTPELRDRFPAALSQELRENVENVFRPEMSHLIPPGLLEALRSVVGSAVTQVFWMALIASVVCLGITLALPPGKRLAERLPHRRGRAGTGGKPN